MGPDTENPSRSSSIDAPYDVGHKEKREERGGKRKEGREKREEKREGRRGKREETIGKNNGEEVGRDRERR